MNYLDENESKFTQYLVPANVSAEFEFIPGFGWREFYIVAVAILIGAILFFLTGLITSTELIDPANLPYEKTIGLNIEKLSKTDEGLLIIKTPIMPAAVRFFFIVIPGAGAFFLVKKEPTSGFSLYTVWKSSKEFHKKQKRYLYKSSSDEVI
jgi:hypothetical protein